MIDRDVIDLLAGLAPDNALAVMRKPVTREQAQASYRALFEADFGDVTAQEHFAIATFVAGLHAEDMAADFYRGGLAGTAPPDAFFIVLSNEIARGRTSGPYGAFPSGKLSVEDTVGPVYAVAEAHRVVLGARLSAALAHVHMLVFHPRDASAAALQTLLDAGWSNDGIVTLSQLVAFLAFQIRAAAGLRVLARSPS
jgi:CMD domain protein